MRKLVYSIFNFLAFVLIGIVLAVTNPSTFKHQSAVVESVIESSSDITNLLGLVFSADVESYNRLFLRLLANQKITKRNFLLFSLTSCEIHNEEKIVGVGILGKVFLLTSGKELKALLLEDSEDIQEAVKNNEVGMSKENANFNSDFKGAAVLIKDSDIQQVLKTWKEFLMQYERVGPPCLKDYHKWIEQNPNKYWGWNLSQMKTFSEDINSDGVYDYLVQLPAENCVGGSGWGSDFCLLLLSDNQKNSQYTYIYITRFIEDLIISKLSQRLLEKKEISHCVVLLDSFSNNISFKFWCYRFQDGACCASISGKCIVTNSADVVEFSFEDKLNEE